MARFVPCGSSLKKIGLILLCVLGFALVRTPVVLAQHSGGHAAVGGRSGGGNRIGGGPLGVPQLPAPVPSSHPPILWSRPFPTATLPAVGSRSFHLLQPQPIYIFHHPAFYRPLFFGFGFGWGFNSYWWESCSPVWNLGFGCTSFPRYGYGFGNYPTLPAYKSPSPLYFDDGGERDLPQLYLNDGTVYNVNDYWLEDSQIHFTTIEGSSKSVEHTMGFNELDLQKTINVNTQRGFRFVLRNEPLEQYLRHHPEPTLPAVSSQPKN